MQKFILIFFWNFDGHGNAARSKEKFLACCIFSVDFLCKISLVVIFIGFCIISAFFLVHLAISLLGSSMTSTQKTISCAGGLSTVICQELYSFAFMRSSSWIFKGHLQAWAKCTGIPKIFHNVVAGLGGSISPQSWWLCGVFSHPTTFSIVPQPPAFGA